MKAILLLLTAVVGLLCVPVTSSIALTIPLGPGVALELSPVGQGDGAFLTTPRPVTRSQFQVFVTETNYRTEAERGTSGGFGYDPATKTVVQRAGYSWKNPGFEQSPDDPVVGVTRDDATAFLTWASRKAGRPLTLPDVRRWEIAAAAFPPVRPTGPGTSVREWTGDMAIQDAGQPARAVLRGASWLQDANKPDLAALSNNASPGSRRPDFGFRAVAGISAAPVPSAPPPAASPAAAQPTRTQVIPQVSPAGNTPDPAATSVAVPASADTVPAVPGGSMGKTAWIIVLLLIALPILVVVALIFAAVKAFSGKAVYAKTSTVPGPPGGGGSGGVSASTVPGGIQVRGSLGVGTPLRVTWADGPADGLTVPYQPGPQGMFIPIEGTIRHLRVATAAGGPIVPGAAVVPVDGGFRVSAAVPDGTMIYASWVDQSGTTQTGSARYDAVGGHALFQTRREPGRIAVSLQPITGQPLPADPPAGASRISGGASGSGLSRGMHTYQDNDRFWTGFWMSDLLSGSSHPTGTRTTTTPNLAGNALFDDQSGIRPSSGRREPPAYH